MNQQISNQKILEKLNKLQEDVNTIKENLIDPDAVLTPEEEDIVDMAFKEYKQGKTISLEEIEKKRAKNAKFEI